MAGAPTVLYEDNFAGAGTLDGHTSDTGQTYASYSYTADGLTLSGGEMSVTANDAGALIDGLAPLPDTFTLSFRAKATSVTGVQYITYRFDLRDYFNCGIEIDSTTIYVILQGASYTFAKDTSYHTYRLEVSPAGRQWYVDGVLVLSGAAYDPDPGTSVRFYLLREGTPSFHVGLGQDRGLKSSGWTRHLASGSMPSATLQRDGPMSGEDEAPTRAAGIERHVQSVLLATITAVVLYSGAFVIGAREDAVRFTGQIAMLASEVAALRTQLTQMQGNYVSREDYRDHEQRLRTLESRWPNGRAQ